MVQGKIYAWHHVPQNTKIHFKRPVKQRRRRKRGNNEEGERRKRKQKIRKYIKQMRLST
jgi:hypothetical protein